MDDARAPADEAWHWSENPSIARFLPHVAATASQPDAYVWAVDAARCPDYWFPRQCPRALAWRRRQTDAVEADALLGSDIDRVHVIEYPWLDALRTTTLFAYPFARRDFRPLDDYALVADHEVTALRPPARFDDALALHEAAGIELRVVPDMFRWWGSVVGSTLGYSGIRLRNSPHFRPTP